MPAKKKKPPAAQPEPPLGSFDGEPIELVAIRLKGGGALDRKLSEGERVVLTCDGVVGLPQMRRLDGRLARIHTVKVELLAEPVDDLADEVERFIQEVDDKREGRQKLPFDDDDDTSSDSDQDGKS